MHKEAIILEISEVKELIKTQFPHWSNLSIEKIDSWGTVNTVYKLGENYSIRIPKTIYGVAQIQKESKWLSKLSRELPLSIPRVIKVGKAGRLYPQIWAIYDWIEGETGVRENLSNISENIELLTGFIKSLQAVEIEEKLAPGYHNGYRGEPLENRDKKTRETIQKLEGLINREIAEKVWSEALIYPARSEELKLIHGDLQSGNILSKNGKIKSIIDFGCLGVGDIACDLMPAWNLLNSTERKGFKCQMSVEESVWKRGRGWSLTVSLVALEYYMHTNKGLAEISKYTIQEIEKEYWY